MTVLARLDHRRVRWVGGWVIGLTAFSRARAPRAPARANSQAVSRSCLLSLFAVLLQLTSTASFATVAEERPSQGESRAFWRHTRCAIPARIVLKAANNFIGQVSLSVRSRT